MRNKLNNKGVKSKLLKTYNKNIQKMNAFKQSSANYKKNETVTSNLLNNKGS